MSAANSQDLSSALNVVSANVKVPQLLAQNTRLIKQHVDATICYEHEKHAAKNSEKHQTHIPVSTPCTTLLIGLPYSSMK